MNEKALDTLIRAELLKGLARYGVMDMPVKQGYQPTTQGRLDKCIYFWALPDIPEGWQYRKHKADEGGQISTTETQIIATSYQMGALIPDDPSDADQKTAKDITVLARMVVQSQPFIIAMTKAGVGVRRPSEVRNPQFVNDQDQYELQPSFDFTVTHKQVIIQLTDSIYSTEFNIHRV
jgi:hypothetical protein